MATYYVRASGGNDANDGLSFANGWATIQFAADTAVGGDTVLICSDNTHLPTAVVEFDINAGAVLTPITFRGASALGVDDGTVATISGASLGVGANLISILTIAPFLNFSNLTFTGSKNHNVVIANITCHAVFTNCKFQNAVADGIQNGSSNTQLTLYNCEISGNGSDGVGVSAATRGKAVYINCSIHDNVSLGVQVGTATNRTSLIRCLIYDNGSHGIDCFNTTAGLYTRIENCTIQGNGGNGINLTDGAYYLFENNIIADNTGYAIDANSLDIDGISICNNNCSYNNTAGHIDINSGVLPGTGHILENPQFVSIVDGSEDYTPQNTNLIKQINYPSGGTTYQWIGAIQPQSSGGRRPHLQIHGI